MELIPWRALPRSYYYEVLINEVFGWLRGNVRVLEWPAQGKDRIQYYITLLEWLEQGYLNKHQIQPGLEATRQTYCLIWTPCCLLCTQVFHDSSNLHRVQHCKGLWWRLDVENSGHLQWYVRIDEVYKPLHFWKRGGGWYLLLLIY